jgi:hypothetical protein
LTGWLIALTTGAATVFALGAAAAAFPAGVFLVAVVRTFTGAAFEAGFAGAALLAVFEAALFDAMVFAMIQVLFVNWYK